MNKLFIAVVAVLFWAATGTHASLPEASDVRQATGITSGLTIVLGSTDGALEQGLVSEGQMLVQGFTTSPEQCAAARKTLYDQKLYGTASIDLIDSYQRLPLYENLVNLLVADLDALGAQAPSVAEIKRVLGFEGAAYLKKNGSWGVERKPTPAETDEYTHWYYDAARSNFSGDGLCNPPNALRWTGWPVSPDGYAAIRVGGGVVFMRTGDGDIMKYPEETERLSIRMVAKDAFSGVTLWQKPIGRVERAFEYAVVGDENLFIYTTPDGRDPGWDSLWLEAWDIRTGESRMRFPVGGLDEVTSCENMDRNMKWRYWGTTLGVTQGKLIYTYGTNLWVRRESDGELLYTKSADEEGIIKTALVADDLLIVLQLAHPCREDVRGFPRTPFHSLTAYNFESGEEEWTVGGSELWNDLNLGSDARLFTPDLTGYKNGLLPLGFHNLPMSETKYKTDDMIVVLLDAGTGTRKWVVRDKIKMQLGKTPERDFFIVGDRLYSSQLGSVRTYDLNDGSILLNESFGYKDDKSGRIDPSLNCHNGTATSKYLLLNKAFVPWQGLADYANAPDKTSPEFYQTRLLSHACYAHLTPAYGTIYSNQGTCNCAALLPGATALYSRMPTTERPDDDRRSTTYVTASSAALSAQTEAANTLVATDWRTPGDRSVMCVSGPRVGSRGTGSIEVWGYSKKTIEKQIGDLLITAYVHEHRITATKDGAVQWNFVAGGRIGSRGELQSDGDRLFFGSHDGYVYAVNLSDGSLAWRVLAAVDDLRMTAFGQVESAWPVFNVVHDNGTLYFCAGRHQDIDGGLHFYSVNAQSGSVNWHVRFKSGIPNDKSEEGEYQRQLTERNTGINGLVSLENGKVVLNASSDFPVVLNAQAPSDSIANPHSLIPPDVEVAIREGRMERVSGTIVPKSDFRVRVLSDGVSLSTGHNESYSISIYDVGGRRIRNVGGVGNGLYKLGFSTMPAGHYTLVVTPTKGIRYVKNILLVR